MSLYFKMSPTDKLVELIDSVSHDAEGPAPTLVHLKPFTTSLQKEAFANLDSTRTELRDILSSTVRLGFSVKHCEVVESVDGYLLLDQPAPYTGKEFTGDLCSVFACGFADRKDDKGCRIGPYKHPNQVYRRLRRALRRIEAFTITIVYVEEDGFEMDIVSLL